MKMTVALAHLVISSRSSNAKVLTTLHAAIHAEQKDYKIH